VADYTSVARVDIAHAFLHEGAVDADDVISRRLRLDSVDADIPAARAAVEKVMDALASAGRLPAGAF
jgi:tRNA A58 N-methylase Trm61